MYLLKEKGSTRPVVEYNKQSWRKFIIGDGSRKFSIEDKV